MKHLGLLVSTLSASCLVGVVDATTIPQPRLEVTELNQDELVKVSEGLNANLNNNSFNLGTNPYKIFDPTKQEFKEVFTTNSDSNQVTNSIIGTSKQEFAKLYGTEVGVGASINNSANLPDIASVNTNFSSKFNMNVGNKLQNAKDTYYEVYETYKKHKITTVDWTSVKNIDAMFNPNFVEGYSTIKNITEALDFLNKYGTNVFKSYTFGGVLSLSSVIISEKNIKEEYKNVGAELSLSRSISMAMNNISDSLGNDISGYASHIEQQKVINEHTDSDFKVSHSGGEYLNGITLDNLFTYNQEYVNERGSGYVYKQWLNSIDEGKNLKVCKVDHPVFIWDLMQNSVSNNAAVNELLMKAYKLQLYSKYSENCMFVNKDPEYISKVDYNTSLGDFSFKARSNEINLPSDSTAKIELGSIITSGLDKSAISFSLKENYPFAKVKQENETYKLELDPTADGHVVKAMINYYDKPIYNLVINVKSGKFQCGYGTFDQPYLLRNRSDWGQFIGNSDYLTNHLYFELDADLDLKGTHFESVGSHKKASFNGFFDGNNHTIKNASILSKGNWNNVGLFGVNSGVIKNLNIENLILLNDKVLTSKDGEINVGVVAGTNEGELINIKVNNCAARFTSQIDKNSTSNIGGFVGKNLGHVNYCSVTNVKIMNQVTNKSNGLVSTGGFIGSDKGGFIENCLIRRSTIKSRNVSNSTSTLRTGGFIGACEGPKSSSSHLQFIISYENIMDSIKENVGYISGIATNGSLFENCYFDQSIDKSVDNKHHDGCYSVTDLTLDNLYNSELLANWTSDENGRPVLKEKLF